MSISKVIKRISESLFGILLIFISKTTLIDVELGEIYIHTEFPKTEIEITQLRLGPLRDLMERRKLQDNTEVEDNKQKVFVKMLKKLLVQQRKLKLQPAELTTKMRAMVQYQIIKSLRNKCIFSLYLSLVVYSAYPAVYILSKLYNLMFSSEI